MHHHLKYLRLITAALLISLAFPGLVSKALAQSDYGEELVKPRPKSPQNRKANAWQLNEEALKLSSQSRFKEALEILEKALAITREQGDRSLEAATLNNTGRVYENQGEYFQALKFYQQALAINQEAGDRVGLGRTFSNIGFLFDRQNKPELAILFYKQCVNNRESIRHNAEAMAKKQRDSYSLTVSDTYRSLAQLLLKQNRVPEAQRILDLIKVQEIDEFLQNVRGNKQTATGINLLQPEQQITQDLNNILARGVELGKELTTLRKISPEQRSQQQKQRIEELVAIQQKILEEFNNFIQSPAVTAQVQELSRTAKQQNLNLNNLNDIRDNLQRFPQKAVLLYPLILEDRLELVLVTADSPPLHRTVPVKREEINSAIVAFRKALENPSRDARIPARQLYDWLIKPIENDLNQANAKTLIYAPDEQLRYIPLAALYDGNQWLVQRFNINHITAASLTDFNTKPQSGLRVLAAAFTKGSFSFKVGNRQFAFSGLPFAGKEVENLVAAVPGTTKLLDDAFSRNATVPQMDDYTIVHLATHAAFMVGKPEDSFILFGNGDRITLKDVGTWSLPSVDLVVLSACETGVGGKLGNGEEILGFGYQMQTTGARAAIASLWSVDDGGTQALMNAFYATLPEAKFTKAESLRQAQIALITGDYTALGQQRGIEVQQRISQSLPATVSDRLNHPYYWAPFILIGNGL